MKPLADCRLYTFVDTGYLRGRDPALVCRQLCEGGADLLQLRAKGAAPAEVRRLAEMLLPITRAAGVGLVINDHPRVALQVGAPWCHLGQEDFFGAGYRTAAQVTGCPKAMRLGLSTHTPDQALRTLKAGPDYIAIGPVYATPTKPAAPPATLDYVRWAASHVHLPWFAIGGITLDTLDAVLDAGARRICAVSAILNAPDVRAACQTFKQHLNRRPLH
ncbi:MAG: thiamine phosphate synthase [Verrucomicrobia bacterium]|nr:thiamine phosphate synthase [Verrucomicrobiota bacterium]